MISYHQLINLLSKFQDLCFSHYPNDFHFLEPQERKKLLGYSESSPQYNSSHSGIYLYKPIESFYLLIKTPRVLKQICRRVYTDWQLLHGEIDFSHLFIARTLFFVAPESFDFLQQHIDTLRLASNGKKGTEGEKYRYQLGISLWQEHINSLSVIWDEQAVWRLICFLLDWDQGPDVTIVSVTTQGLANVLPTDYFYRLSIGEIPANTIRDQDIIKLISKWKEKKISDDSIKLVEKLCNDNDFALKFEYLGSIFMYHNGGFLLNSQEIRDMCDHVFSMAYKTFGSSLTDSNIKGFWPLLRLYISRIQPEEHYDWIKNQLEKFLQLSLTFFNALYIKWRISRHGRGQDESVYDYIIEIAKKTFQNEPLKYLSILNESEISSTYNFCILTSSDNFEPEFELEKWLWLADVLMECLKECPSKIIPQVAYLFVNIAIDDEDQRHFQFNQKHSNDLFQSHLLELKTMFLKFSEETLSSLSDKDKEYVQVATDGFRELEIT